VAKNKACAPHCIHVPAACMWGHQFLLLQTSSTAPTLLSCVVTQDDGNLVAKHRDYAWTPYWASNSGPGLGTAPFHLVVSGQK
jgi:hypothetical protein